MKYGKRSFLPERLTSGSTDLTCTGGSILWRSVRLPEIRCQKFYIIPPPDGKWPRWKKELIPITTGMNWWSNSYPKSLKGLFSLPLYGDVHVKPPYWILSGRQPIQHHLKRTRLYWPGVMTRLLHRRSSGEPILRSIKWRFVIGVKRVISRNSRRHRLHNNCLAISISTTTPL